MDSSFDLSFEERIRMQREARLNPAGADAISILERREKQLAEQQRAQFEDAITRLQANIHPFLNQRILASDAEKLLDITHRAATGARSEENLSGMDWLKHAASAVTLPYATAAKVPSKEEKGPKAEKEKKAPKEKIISEKIKQPKPKQEYTPRSRGMKTVYSSSTPNGKLQEVWHQFLVKYDLSVTNIASAWNACSASDITRNSVSGAQYRLRSGSNASELWTIISTPNTHFFDALGIKVEEQDKQKLIDTISAARDAGPQLGYSR